MADKKHIDQDRVAEMRRVMAEKGDKGVDERYGAEARRSEEYAEAQRQAEAQEQRDRERHRHEIEQSHERATADRERFQRKQDRLDAERDAQARDQQEREDQQRQADQAREQQELKEDLSRQADQDGRTYVRETSGTDRVFELSSDAAPSADRGAEQSAPEQPTEKPAPAREPDLADRLIAKQAAQREAREREGVTR